LDKAPDAFRTISEVADELDVPQHVLRFWETRFTQIKPMKRSGGRRYYRPEDVDLLRGIRHLLYGQGYTIRGVQRILREQGVKTVQNWQPGSPLPGAASVGSPGVEAHRSVPSLASAMEDDEEDAENILHDAVSEDDGEDFNAGEGEDLGDEMSDFSTSISSSSISSWVNAAAQHRRPAGVAPPPPDIPDIAATLSEPARWDQGKAGKLKTALDELLECRRMLDDVLAGK
jgi:DNA-binding transcriptional MerR regulator